MSKLYSRTILYSSSPSQLSNQPCREEFSDLWSHSRPLCTLEMTVHNVLTLWVGARLESTTDCSGCRQPPSAGRLWQSVSGSSLLGPELLMCLSAQCYMTNNPLTLSGGNYYTPPADLQKDSACCQARKGMRQKLAPHVRKKGLGVQWECYYFASRG